MAAALRLLAARPRSESQLRERLLERADRELVDECIARLKEMGYVDDLRYAESYASHRVRNKSIGRSRVSRELARREVPNDVIDEALDSVFEDTDEEALIDRAIEKRIRLRGRLKDAGDVKKMIAHLMRLGFGYDLIRRKLRAIRDEDLEVTGDEQ
jgi:regulatory protein